jgi:hypothetical protein
MQALHLDNNDIDDRGAEHVAAALPYMPRLQLLDVGFNRLTAAGVKALMRALAGNSSLRSLTLSGNALHSEGARAVAEALALNAALAELRLDHAGIGHTGERLLAAALEQAPFPGLKTLTGVRLGPVLARGGQGFPPELDGASNEQALEWLRLRRQHPPMGASGGGGGADLAALLRAVMAGGESCGGGGGDGGRASGCSGGSGPGAEEPTMMALSTPPLPTFYGRSAGGKTTPPTAPVTATATGPAPVGTAVVGGCHSHRPTAQYTQPYAAAPPSARATAASTATATATAPASPCALPPLVAQGLAECGHLPWDPAELFALHQRYFSPPPKPKITSPPQPQYHPPHHAQHRTSGLGARKREELEEEEREEGAGQEEGKDRTPHHPCLPSAAPGPAPAPMLMLRVESESAFPPAPKKQCVTTATLVRIGLYPRLKARIEQMLKGQMQEPAVLVLLRQLRFLEGQQQVALAPEQIEAVLLDTLS